MLSKMDDYPIHQTGEPVARPASSDRHVYDRYWFNGYQDDGAFYFGIGAALYPNLEIMDCGFSIVIDGEQHAFHGSRRARRNPGSRHRPLEARDPRADEEPARDDRRQRDRHRRRSALDRADRQHRRGLPALRAPHRPHGGDALQPVRILGGRDPLRRTLAAHRSVPRVRHQGPQLGHPSRRRPGAARRPPLAWRHLVIWAPLHWSDRCTHVSLFENEHGWPCISTAWVSVYGARRDPGVEDPRVELLAACEHTIDFVPGTRRARACSR
jgi:hypothetical protein